MQKRLISMVFIITICFGLLLIGCKDAEGTVPEASTAEAVSEVVSEEVSEPVSEEPSEEVVSEEPVEEAMDLTPYTTENGKKVIDLVNDMNYDELKIIVWAKGEGAKIILSDGDIYEVEEDELLYLYYPQKMSSIVNADYIEIFSQYDNVAGFGLTSYGEDMEVTFTTTDEKGKEYTITVYLTEAPSES